MPIIVGFVVYMEIVFIIARPTRRISHPLNYYIIIKHGGSVTEMKTNPGGSIEGNIGLLYGTAVQK